MNVDVCVLLLVFVREAILDCLFVWMTMRMAEGRPTDSPHTFDPQMPECRRLCSYLPICGSVQIVSSYI